MVFSGLSVFLTESTSSLLTRLLLEDLGPLRLHRVFGVIRRLIDSSVLDDRILSLYHVALDYDAAPTNTHEKNTYGLPDANIIAP